MGSAVTDYGVIHWTGMLVGLYPVPETYWVALCWQEPGPSIDGTDLAAIEPGSLAGSNYARQPLPATDAAWDEATTGFVINVEPLDFGTPDMDWGLPRYFALCDAQTEGNVYAYGLFINPTQLNAGIAVALPKGSVVIQATSLNRTIVA